MWRTDIPVCEDEIDNSQLLYCMNKEVFYCFNPQSETYMQ